MFPLLSRDTPSSLLEKTKYHIDQFSKEGLRTLLVTKREINSDEYYEWNQQFGLASSSIEDRHHQVKKILGNFSIFC